MRLLSPARMARYKLVVQYIGSQYHGWQAQGGALRDDQFTVQRVLQDAVAKMLPGQQPSVVVGCGRTDKGVHALALPAHVDVDRVCRRTGLAKEAFSADVLKTGLNWHLRFTDVRVTDVRRVSQRFHARMTAESRTYLYRVLHGCTEVSIFERNRVYHVFETLDVQRMIDGCKYLIGTHDFSSFRDHKCEARHPVRTITRFDIKQQDVYCLFESTKHPGMGSLLNIVVTANAFLYHQVRSMVGVLVEVGRGAIEPDDVKRILEARDRSILPNMAPPCGLYFLHAEYKPELEDVDESDSRTPHADLGNLSYI